MKQISVLGCGWLGLPLAKALLNQNYSVKGSTTSLTKKEALENLGVKHYVIALETEKPTANFDDFLANSHTLIIAIPPRLKGKKKDYTDPQQNSFVKKIENIIPHIQKSKIENVLFISSTAVYGDTNDTITEDSIPLPTTESGKQLLEIEELLLENDGFKTTILRFGGLIGPDRHPARFLAAKENVPNPDAPINLIDLEDCIGIILSILKKNIWNERFNAVTPYHPTRATYYTTKALEQNLVPPQFNYENPSTGKIILSDKIETMLGYTFIKNKL
ncbi:NAD-dependent epimerase/dehydratase family protein [Flavobacterium adhaerens]|uniref:NAD-dependent epimerase/dehydratase family protein n=1 Tax=Flavobacterium adhaerens TaxID=3149043 RepID=UPI0032B54FDF